MNPKTSLSKSAAKIRPFTTIPGSRKEATQTRYNEPLPERKYVLYVMK